MAAPASITVQDLTGKYVLNKKIGDDPDALLAMVSPLLLSIITMRCVYQ